MTSGTSKASMLIAALLLSESRAGDNLSASRSVQAAVAAGLTPQALVDVAASAAQAQSVLASIRDAEEELAAFVGADAALRSATAAHEVAIRKWRKNPASTVATTELRTAAADKRSAIDTLVASAAAIRASATVALTGEQAAALRPAITPARLAADAARLRSGRALPQVRRRTEPMEFETLMAVFAQ